MNIKINTLVDTFKERNIEIITVDRGTEALDKIKELIPHGASVTNGASTTLEQIGYIEYLKSGAHGWNNLHEKVINEKDPARQTLLRKETTIADYYLGSVHALTEHGELMIASATGSQMPGIVFNASNLVFVVSAKKIVPDITAGIERIREQVIPLEEARMQKAHGMGTMLAKLLIFFRESPLMHRSVRVILVKEDLGF